MPISNDFSFNLPLRKEQIFKILPYGDEFLFIDQITELTPGEKAVGILTVTEKMCVGHFPGNPILPGVLILETLQQVGVMALLTDPRYAGKLVYVHEVESVKFRQPVRPGDRLQITSEITEIKERNGKIFGEATGVVSVNGEVVAKGKVKFIIEENEKPSI